MLDFFAKAYFWFYERRIEAEEAAERNAYDRVKEFIYYFQEQKNCGNFQRVGSFPKKVEVKIHSCKTIKVISYMQLRAEYKKCIDIFLYILNPRYVKTEEYQTLKWMKKWIEKQIRECGEIVFPNSYENKY